MHCGQHPRLVHPSKADMPFWTCLCAWIQAKYAETQYLDPARSSPPPPLVLPHPLSFPGGEGGGVG